MERASLTPKSRLRKFTVGFRQFLLSLGLLLFAASSAIAAPLALTVSGTPARMYMVIGAFLIAWFAAILLVRSRSSSAQPRQKMIWAF